MKSDPHWSSKPPEFWHYSRAISEKIGYSRTDKNGRKIVLRHDSTEIEEALQSLSLSSTALRNNSIPGLNIEALVNYFDFRADLIENTVARNLQDSQQAKSTFEQVVKKYTDGTFTSLFNKNKQENIRYYNVTGGVPAAAPFNKQKHEKRDIDFLTAAANILISYHLKGESFDQDPRKIPLVTEKQILTGSMSRRMDGAYPQTINPSAVWEFKVYYYTTTFGSKISDAVYITDLDGRERNDIEKETKKHIHTTLFMDSYPALYQQGISYLVRFIDMLQRGAVDNIVFGKELVDEITRLVKEWKSEERKPNEADPNNSPPQSR